PLNFASTDEGSYGGSLIIRDTGFDPDQREIAALYSTPFYFRNYRVVYVDGRNNSRRAGRAHLLWHRDRRPTSDEPYNATVHCRTCRHWLPLHPRRSADVRRSRLHS